MSHQNLKLKQKGENSQISHKSNRNNIIFPKQFNQNQNSDKNMQTNFEEFNEMQQLNQSGLKSGYKCYQQDILEQKEHFKIIKQSNHKLQKIKDNQIYYQQNKDQLNFVKLYNQIYNNKNIQQQAQKSFLLEGDEQLEKLSDSQQFQSKQQKSQSQKKEFKQYKDLNYQDLIQQTEEENESEFGSSTVQLKSINKHNSCQKKYSPYEKSTKIYDKENKQFELQLSSKHRSHNKYENEKFGTKNKNNNAEVNLNINDLQLQVNTDLKNEQEDQNNNDRKKQVHSPLKNIKLLKKSKFNQIRHKSLQNSSILNKGIYINTNLENNDISYQGFISYSKQNYSKFQSPIEESNNQIKNNSENDDEKNNIINTTHFDIGEIIEGYQLEQIKKLKELQNNILRQQNEQQQANNEIQKNKNQQELEELQLQLLKNNNSLINVNQKQSKQFFLIDNMDKIPKNNYKQYQQAKKFSNSYQKESYLKKNQQQIDIQQLCFEL
ncbi:hypothetical protein PPERSA_09874 [Pseudocohnilembus persalinus]|uniref:Uncharacterized protein n=1 Tax=Pseudocohnilembus persalinus TaxID=266149 RepID=A0A0V0QU44_PSEPJ|nr:hypothetical protein PPERSA_09874 [Pseudocohnilembus persalinus]|eukprot:KRX05734.1 hypothetical protein PPERSA_09874 [Pseudocohnilembus persalinus]